MSWLTLVTLAACTGSPASPTTASHTAAEPATTEIQATPATGPPTGDSATGTTAQQPAAAVPGCEFRPLDLTGYDSPAFDNPPTIASADGVLNATLEIGYSDHTIDHCPVHLRTYNGQLVGPTLRVKPGDTIHLTLTNSLPPNPDADGSHEDPFTINGPHLLNSTNLHTHGLHVSPEGNSDNVLLSIEPQTTFEYEIAIPDDHPAGTFWYHAHHHGSPACCR